jgi:hypothetical protein
VLEKGMSSGWPRGAFGGQGRVGSALLTASSARPDANKEAEQTHVGLSPQRNFGHTSGVARLVVNSEPVVATRCRTRG